MERTRRILALLCCGTSLLLAACGGGGGGGSTGSSNVVGLPASAVQPSDPNYTQISVAAGPQRNVNIPYVRVKVCVPGSTTNCSTISNVLLDTGSTGLRLLSGQVGVALPAQTLNAGSVTSVGECAEFLSTMAWGPVKVADVVIGGLTAPSVPVQLIDTSFAGRPASCNLPLLSTSTNLSATPPTAALSANGILGVGVFANDLQSYFDCSAAGTCAALATPSAAQQVQNPVSLFPSDNNGVVVQLGGPVPSGGATSAPGYLIFGVATRANNQLGSATVVPLDGAGQFTTVYKGVSMSRSFIDSGSNGLYFHDTALATPACTRASSGFYCGTGSSLGATIGGHAVSFSIASADGLFYNASGQANSFYVFSNLGGDNSDAGSFDWGLPFFFGRSVYTVIQGKAVTGAPAGPWVGFTN